MFCGASVAGGAKAGAAMGRIVGIRLCGGSGEPGDGAGTGEVDDLPGGDGIFVHDERQQGAIQEKFV